MTSATLTHSVAAISVATTLLMGTVGLGTDPYPAKHHARAVRVNNIVLVHGAWADGSGWEGVYKILKNKGYNVTIVANPNTSLAEDVRITKAVLALQDGATILVGHSYGGAIITEAGDNSNVSGLGYVAAFSPDAGESLLKTQQSGPPDPNSPALPPHDVYISVDTATF